MALQVCLSIPRFSSNIATLVEKEDLPIFLESASSGLRHIERLQQALSV